MGLGLDPLHHLGVGKVAVAARDDQGVGPRLPQALDQPSQHREHLRTAEALGREDRGDQASREALIHVKGEETLATIIAIIPDLLLLAMGGVLGVIEVEHDELGGTVVGGDKLLQKHECQAVELGAGDTVFKA